MTHCCRVFSRFLRDSAGTVSFEFMIWIPLVFGILVTLLDFAHALTVNSAMWHETRNAARGLSMHSLSESEARASINNGLAWTDADYAIRISRDRTSVSVHVETPMRSSGLVDFATARLKGNWVTRVTLLQEPV